MYLVKSCKKKDHPHQSGTLKIGSLAEYRDTENKQVEDREEGFYRIKFDLNDKWISTDLFNYLNYSHSSNLSAHIHLLNIKNQDFSSVRVDYKADYKWVNHNRFIFCITKTERVEEAQGIFSGYDDSWSVNYNKIAWLKRSMEMAVLDKIKGMISSGNLIFGDSFNNPDKISIESYSQDIIYQTRDLYLGNKDIDPMTDTLISLFKNVKFIKPVYFRKEKELRFVFDFYYDGQIVFPQINSLIIPSEGIVDLFD